MNPYLILVNKANAVPDDFLSLVELVPMCGTGGDTFFIESRTKKAYEALVACVKEQENITIGAANAYRSPEMQQQTYDRLFSRYGKDYADAIVAPVGKSEHHTGLCIDLELYFEGEGFLNNNKNVHRTAPIFEAHVHPHLTKFGFILRYPEGKEKITGYPYEPWHIRYVGREAAEEMLQKGLTMDQWAAL